MDDRLTGLLIVVLSFIRLRGGQILLTELSKLLKELLDCELEQSACFGNVQKLVTKQFVSDGFLNIENLNELEGPALILIREGPRSGMQFNKIEDCIEKIIADANAATS
ncbi:hypothetical protein ACOME3_002419 [Neoechinorhynchus agilis]